MHALLGHMMLYWPCSSGSDHHGLRPVSYYLYPLPLYGMYGAHEERMGQVRPDMHGNIMSALTCCVHDHHKTWMLSLFARVVLLALMLGEYFMMVDLSYSGLQNKLG